MLPVLLLVYMMDMPSHGLREQSLRPYLVLRLQIGQV